jgi:hypothetical protein
LVFAARCRDMEIPAAMDRHLQRSDSELRGIHSGDETAHRVIMPAINPFIIKNREPSDKEIDERLGHYEIPTDLPLVVQISRFDPWKDHKGVVEVFKLASKEVDARLVMLGNFATDGLDCRREKRTHIDEEVAIWCVASESYTGAESDRKDRALLGPSRGQVKPSGSPESQRAVHVGSLRRKLGQTQDLWGAKALFRCLVKHTQPVFGRL